MEHYAESVYAKRRQGLSVQLICKSLLSISARQDSVVVRAAGQWAPLDSEFRPIYATH